MDAISERLSRAKDNVRFFVVGNPSRLGPTARMFLIDEQIERRPSVLSAKRALDHFQGFDNVIQAALRAARSKWLSKGHEDYIARRTQQCVDDDLPVALDGWSALVDAYLRQRYHHAVHLSAWLRKKASDASQRLVTAREQERKLLLTQTKAVLCTVAAIPRTIEFLSDPDTDVHQLVCPIDTAIIDEAGTISEQELPVLLMMGAVRIIAIGDQRQLAPFTYADQRDYEPVGFFQRLDACFTGTSAIPMLTEQYRMHPTIASVVSHCFYSNQLITPPSIVQARNCPKPLVWLDCPGRETNDGTSKVNWGEIKYIAALIPTLQQTEVAVISFYKPQIRLLELCVVARDDQDVRFLTADSAQGSEYDAVILSCVRSNSDHNIGFVSNPNRLCVAFSRAKEEQIIVGNLDTMSGAGCQPLLKLAQSAIRDPDRQAWVQRQPTPDFILEAKAEHDEKEAKRESRRFRGRGKGGGGKGNGKGRGKAFSGGKGRGRYRFFF